MPSASFTVGSAPAARRARTTSAWPRVAGGLERAAGGPRAGALVDVRVRPGGEQGVGDLGVAGEGGQDQRAVAEAVRVGPVGQASPYGVEVADRGGEVEVQRQPGVGHPADGWRFEHVQQLQLVPRLRRHVGEGHVLGRHAGLGQRRQRPIRPGRGGGQRQPAAIHRQPADRPGPGEHLHRLGPRRVVGHRPEPPAAAVLDPLRVGVGDEFRQRLAQRRRVVDAGLADEQPQRLRVGRDRRPQQRLTARPAGKVARPVIDRPAERAFIPMHQLAAANSCPSLAVDLELYASGQHRSQQRRALARGPAAKFGPRRANAPSASSTSNDAPASNNNRTTSSRPVSRRQCDRPDAGHVAKQVPLPQQRHFFLGKPDAVRVGTGIEQDLGGLGVADSCRPDKTSSDIGIGPGVPEACA